MQTLGQGGAPSIPEAVAERLREISMLRLRPFLEESSHVLLEEILLETPCVVTPVRARRTKHGDHRQRVGEGFSEVTVNVSGNRYQFLITLLHELAHAITLQRHGKRAPAHGREWQRIFADLLNRALASSLFPADLAPHVERQARRGPHASSSRDAALQLALRQHDTLDHRPMVTELEEGTLFSLDGKLLLRRGNRVRTRYHCVAPNGQEYRVSATARVHTIYRERQGEEK
jgi:SprT protein